MALLIATCEGFQHEILIQKENKGITSPESPAVSIRKNQSIGC